MLPARGPECGNQVLRAGRDAPGQAVRPGQAAVLSGGAGVGGSLPDSVRASRARPRTGLAAVSLAILIELWVRTPHPHHIWAPSCPSKRVRRHAKSRFKQAILASEPVRHLTSFTKLRPRCTLMRAAVGLPRVCAIPRSVARLDEFS